MKNMTPIVFDIECYPNYFALGWRIADRPDGKPSPLLYGARQGVIRDQEGAVRWLKHCGTRDEWLLTGFNSRRYDLPLLGLIAAGNNAWKANEALFADEGLWAKCYPEPHRHCDLMALCPPFVSLKDMEARLSLPRLQSLPVEPGTRLTALQQQMVEDYLVNSDLPATEALFHALREPYQARVDSGNPRFLYLTDAQIAEVILVPQFAYKAEDMTRYKGGYCFPGSPAERERIISPAGKQALAYMEGSATTPPCEEFLSFGRGGLHSKEKDSWFAADEEWGIVDADVASYYPAMIINYNGLASGTPIYTAIRDKRLQLKAAGDPAQAMYKIVLNGTFGKMNSQYSKLYCPGALENITRTGQILLAELYGRIVEIAGDGRFKVLSVNTDGITVTYRRSAMFDLHQIFLGWQNTFRLTLEFQAIDKLLHRDVNNYWAITPDGKVKRKGVAVPAGLRSNPNCDVAALAVERFLLDGTPLMATIAAAGVKDFLIYRKSTKGVIATAAGECLGSNVRYVYGMPGSPLTTSLRTERGQIARGGNVIPVMDFTQLPPEIEQWIDYNRVLKQAQDYMKGYYNAQQG